ncbi:retinol dehydrogenase 12-like isoform X2 [Scylla paramamosain]|uniref:retinol dehydrogenase 12-like isoform X2 n=1 Tax=Scylla paramamosain TaxID=85552 RepID=UPI003082F91A
MGGRSEASSKSAEWLTTMWLEILVTLVVVVMSVRFWYMYTSGHCTSTTSMAGKTVIITGSTAGIGKETARDLLRRSARVIIACRNLEKGCKVAGELQSDGDARGEVVVRRLDTSDLSSVRNFAKEVLETEKAIHVLINNAGIYGMGKRQVTADGLELTMATNHFGHFLLTNLLLGRLKESGPSRIINVSSLGHIFAPKFDLNDLAINNDYNPNNAYTTSKLCNLLFTRELADKMAGTGVTVNSLHPGIVRTEIFDSMNLSFGTFLTHILLAVASKDAVSGAQTSIHLAVSEEVEGMTGRYFGDCKEVSTSDVALRKDLATGLWEASVKAVGLKKDEIHY